MMPGRRWVLGAPLALGACAKGGGLASACPGRPIGQVPMVPAGGVWIVPAKMNGQDVGMVLDTGSDRNALGRDGFRALGLRYYGGHEQVTNGLAGARQGKFAQIDQFAFAGIPLHGLLFPIEDFRAPKFDLLPVYGILGMSNLFVFDFQLDFTERTLKLYPHADCDRPTPDWTEPYTAVPIHTVSSSRNGNPAVDVISAGKQPELERQEVARVLLEVSVNGHPFTALMDTGASGTVLNADAASLAGMGSGGEPIHISDIAGNRSDAYRQRVDKVRIGTATWTDVPITILRGRLEYGVDMLFGQDLMRGHRLWAMLAAKKLFIQRVT